MNDMTRKLLDLFAEKPYRSTQELGDATGDYFNAIEALTDLTRIGAVQGCDKRDGICRSAQLSDDALAHAVAAALEARKDLQTAQEQIAELKNRIRQAHAMLDAQ